MSEMGILLFLATCGWVGEQTLFRKFGEETVSKLLGSGSIKRRWKHDPLFAEYEYTITDKGRLLLGTNG